MLDENEKSKIEITSFQDLIKKANDDKEIELKYDLERNVKLVSFNRGKWTSVSMRSLIKILLKI